MDCIPFDRRPWEVANGRLTQTNEVDDRRTDYDANSPKSRIPTVCAVIFHARHEGVSDWRTIAPNKPAITFPPELLCTVFPIILLFPNDCARSRKRFLR